MPITSTVGGRGGRGALIATFTVTRASPNRGRSSEFGPASGGWELSAYGRAVGFAIDGARLTAPNMRPDRIVGLDVVGGEEYSGSVLPWFGELHNLQGVGGAVVLTSAGERLSVRKHQAEEPREIRIAGADTPISVGATIKLYAMLG